MKIVFWSNYPKSSVTSNMTAVGIMFSIMFPSKVMMMTNHCNYENLGRTILGVCYDDMLREEMSTYNRNNVTPKVKKIDYVPSRYDIPKDVTDFSEYGLYYFAQGKQFNNEIYEFRVLEEINYFIDCINESDEYIFIDAKSQDSMSTIRLLEEADLVVVNLKQDEQLIRDFFRKYGSIAGKSFFFLSAYRKYEKPSLKKFSREFSIHMDRIALIPYLAEFAPNTFDGRITEFIMNHHRCKKTDREYYYIRNVKRAAHLLKKIIDNQPKLSYGYEEQEYA